MGVDVCCGIKRGMSQPILNLFHGNALCQKQAGTAVPEVMEANFPQPILRQQQLKMIGNVVGPKQLAHLVNTDIVLIVSTVRAFEQALVTKLACVLHTDELNWYNDSTESLYRLMCNGSPLSWQPLLDAQLHHIA